MLWLTGGSQGDIALLTSKNINGEVLTYQRRKLKPEAPPARISIGPSLHELLEKLPRTGPFFPTIALIESKHRAAEFNRRCRVLTIKGVTLH